MIDPTLALFKGKTVEGTALDQRKMALVIYFTDGSLSEIELRTGLGSILHVAPPSEEEIATRPAGFFKAHGGDKPHCAFVVKEPGIVP